MLQTLTTKFIALNKKKKTALLGFFFLLIIWLFCLPNQLFNDPYSTVLLDKNKQLLGASIAKDGQWRFPETDSIPQKFKTALIHFEDKQFYYHIGINPFSILRAASQNISKGRIVSGGSTLTMQVIRLSRKGKARTFTEKIVEFFQATRLELSYSKEEILNLYASHAPFGGNVVGLKAASWRYFGRQAHELSWAEAAMLAVLPNRPGLIFPGKSQQILKKKRDRLLSELQQKGLFDSLTLVLAQSEEIPKKPKRLPNFAPHLLTRSLNEGLGGKTIQTTVDLFLQQRVQNVINRHKVFLEANGIYNMAVLVLDVNSGDALAYLGNRDAEISEKHGMNVDVITASRSTGSTLKPLLFASMLDEGILLPTTLVADIPTYFTGFAPRNFNKKFDGAVHANMALSRSLNVPAVRMLQKYGYPKFHHKLKTLGISTLHKPAGHYGLSLILGGSEATLWELTSIYASFGRTLNNYYRYDEPFRYNTNDFRTAHYLSEKSTALKSPKGNQREGILSAAAIFKTVEAMLEVYRPASESSWELYETSQKIAWKTGTSFGHRDAWAIGITPKYAVGIWVGNADGEGRPNMTGLSSAAPVLFDVFSLLPSQSWFEPPFDELKQVPICRKSGKLATQICSPIDTLDIPEMGLKTSACDYHKMVHLDKKREFQVHSDCESVNEMQHVSRFVLPPIQEYYYKKRNPDYEELPPFKESCLNNANLSAMQLIYPTYGAKIFIPKELKGELGEVIFEVAHRNPSTLIYWHIDDEYIGQTKRIHQMAMQPKSGKHLLTLIDENGELLKRTFEILEK